MRIFNEITLQSLFIILFGVFIFTIGTTMLRSYYRRKKGMVNQGTVIKSKHFDKRDADGNLIQNYYELEVEYRNNNQIERCKVNNHREYQKGDIVELVKNNAIRNNISISESDDASFITIWSIILGGIVIVCMPFAEQKYGLGISSLLLAMVLLFAGVSLIATYYKNKNRKTIAVEATIVDVLQWYNARKDTKLIKRSVSYYPILQYSMNNKIKNMRSKYSSSVKNKFPIGTKQTIYIDSENGHVIEKAPRVSMLIFGIVLFAIAIIGIASNITI
ncbi:DUF3592 domain-containing protein [Anaeromicropila herbilytica]|uniref:DUF3592 domain-containing protein n=1 Tax=Anaeromicropila herbilytica TaxID=2785025 RepID=A0A7R7EIG0_9FIRM|nr:hypothetical protein [Anaeromicropila herbilytica]BCN29340.1 hypothetical protein bsdtb5_06350 [Anaeromicropila herbilytica]